MAEIDPVVLELRAELGKYRADIRTLTNEVTTRLGIQEASVKSLEDQFSRSSASIGSTVKGLAGTLGALFTGREVVAMVDSFTRLQNSLKVAGLEGQQLEGVQSSLLELSKRYGVGIEGLANLYGKATDAGRSFGASEAEILQLTEATSQALLITGTGAEQASGAILGLSQALASGTVRAEEYNQINEGGLRPLLQAAAASERFGGDINKLLAAMLDGKVTSQEFFAGILAGSAQLSGQAAKATLTLSGAYEALTSALTVYVGQAAQSNGVTNALAGGLQTLAENLDSLVTVLAVFATFIAGRYVGALAASAAAALATARANVILSASAVGAGTSMQVMAVRATLAGRALLAAFGGPVGLAVSALTLGLGALAYESQQAAAASEALQRQMADSTAQLDSMTAKLKAAGVSTEELSRISDIAAGRVDKLADSYNRASVEAHKMATAISTATIEMLKQAAVASAAAKADRLNAERELSQASGIDPYNRSGNRDRLLRPGNAGIRADLEKRIADARAEERRQDAIQEAAKTAFANKVDLGGPPGSPPASTDKPKKTPKGRQKAAEDIEAKLFRATQDELNAQIEVLRAKSRLALEAGERGELERDTANIEAQLRENEIAEALRKKDITADQAKAQRIILAQLYGQVEAFDEAKGIAVRAQQSLYGMAVARDERLQAEQEAADIAEESFRAQSEALRQQYDLAKSQAERRTLAFEIIDLEYRERDAALERIKNNEDLSAAVRDRAAIEQAALREAQGRTTEQARRDTAGPLENYFDRAKKDAAELNEAYEQIAVDGLQSLNDGLADAIVNSKSLGDVFKNVAKQIIADLIRIAIQQVIVNTLMSSVSGGVGGGGGFGGILGSIFGRASGGYVAPGQTVRVNEQRGGAEYLRMGSQGGQVIPLGQVNQRAASSAPVIKVISSPQFDLRGAVMTPKLYADMERIAQANAAEAGAAAYQRSIQDAPSAVARAQRYGQ